MGVLLRECTSNAARDIPSLSEGIADALKETGALFAKWIKQGLVRSDFPPEHLAWELFSPLINLRLAYLNPNSSEADISRARAFGRRHAEFFLSSVVTSKEMDQ
jgi:hypothetical protein